MINSPLALRRGSMILLLLAFLVLLGLAESASAQFPQYVTPGTVGQPPADLEDELDRAVEEARWQLGGLRLQPWIGVRDVSYIDNIFADDDSVESDVTVSAGAGLHGYVPVGTDFVFSLYALPEYTWWNDQEERNRLNGRYGVGLFYFRDRLIAQVRAQRTEQQQFVTPEVQQLTNARTDTALAGLDFQIYRSLWAFGSAQYQEFTNNLEDEQDLGLPNFQRFDREEDVYRAGIQFRLAGEKVILGLGVEDSSVSFAPGAQREDNEGTSPLLTFLYDGPWFGSSIDVVDRELEPVGESVFVPLDEITGRASFFTTRESPLSGSIYGYRYLNYTLDPGSSWALDERLGASIGFRFSRLVGMRAFGEEGDLTYQSFAGVPFDRVDEVSAFGASMDVGFGFATASFVWTEERYDSNLPDFDRDISRFSVRFGIGGGPLGWP